MATVSGSASTTTRNPRHWQLAVLVIATLPEIPTGLGHRARSFDYLVGAAEQGWRHVEAEGLGRDQVDDQLEFGRLLDRKVCRLRAAQNLVDKVGGAAIEVQKVRSIRHQTACFEITALRINRRQARGERKHINAHL